MDWKLLENHESFSKSCDEYILSNIHKLSFWNSIEVLEHEPVYTVTDVIRVLNIDQRLILKSLFFEMVPENLCLANLCGSDKADLQKIKNIVCCEHIKLLKPEDIYTKTHISLGAISLLVYNHPPVLIDNRVKENKYSYLGTGLNNFSFKVMTDQLQCLDYLTWCDLRKS